MAEKITPTAPITVTVYGVRPTLRAPLAAGVMTRVIEGLRNELIIGHIVG